MIINKENFNSALALAKKASTGLNLWMDVEPFGSNSILLRGQDQEYCDKPRIEIIFPREDDYEA